MSKLVTNEQNTELASVLKDCESKLKTLLSSLRLDPELDNSTEALERIEKLCADMRLIRFDFNQPILRPLNDKEP